MLYEKKQAVMCVTVDLVNVVNKNLSRRQNHEQAGKKNQVRNDLSQYMG